MECDCIVLHMFWIENPFEQDAILLDLLQTMR